MSVSRPVLVYDIDTDSWIELQKHFKRKNFGTLWDRLHRLAEEGRLVVAEEVQRELGTDVTEDPVAFLRDHPSVIRGTAELWTRAQSVAGAYPDLVDLAKPNGSADPFVIAAALEERDARADSLWPATVIVVTQERRTRPSKIQIPEACDDLGLQVVKLEGLLDSEGWDDL